MRATNGWIAFAVGLLLPLGAWAATPPTADLVLIHGHILTMDAKDQAVEAVAIRGTTILATGDDRQMLSLAGKGAKIIDLHGRRAVRQQSAQCPDAMSR